MVYQPLTPCDKHSDNRIPMHVAIEHSMLMKESHSSVCMCFFTLTGISAGSGLQVKKFPVIVIQMLSKVFKLSHSFIRSFRILITKVGLRRSIYWVYDPQ